MNESTKINNNNNNSHLDSKPYKQVKIIDNNITIEEPSEDIIEPKVRCVFIQETIKKGSLLEGIFNLSIFTLGVGLLAIPQKVKYMSLFMTPVIIISGGVINYIQNNYFFYFN